MPFQNKEPNSLKENAMFEKKFKIIQQYCRNCLLKNYPNDLIKICVKYSLVAYRWSTDIYNNPNIATQNLKSELPTITSNGCIVKYPSNKSAWRLAMFDAPFVLDPSYNESQTIEELHAKQQKLENQCKDYDEMDNDMISEKKQNSMIQFVTDINFKKKNQNDGDKFDNENDTKQNNKQTIMHSYSLIIHELSLHPNICPLKFSFIDYQTYYDFRINRNSFTVSNLWFSRSGDWVNPRVMHSDICAEKGDCISFVYKSVVNDSKELQNICEIHINGEMTPYKYIDLPNIVFPVIEAVDNVCVEIVPGIPKNAATSGKIKQNVEYKHIHIM